HAVTDLHKDVQSLFKRKWALPFQKLIERYSLHKLHNHIRLVALSSSEIINGGDVWMSQVTDNARFQFEARNNFFTDLMFMDHFYRYEFIEVRMSCLENNSDAASSQFVQKFVMRGQRCSHWLGALEQFLVTRGQWFQRQL